MEEVGSVSLAIKVLKKQLMADIKSSIKDAAKEAKSEAKSMGKAISDGMSGATGAVTGLVSAFKTLLGVLGIGLSVASLVKFGKECVDLGSDLSEVQNVVDVTFGDMSDKVNEFARSSIKSYGISETAAKNYMGTLGAMSQAFGFSSAEAYGQAEALTALAGDMASFYNKTTEETFNALRSVYSGETEVLKQYGVVMTETALNEFALAQGIGKTVNQMSEQEKVALRLQFVQNKLTKASGDFARTQNSWANQTRVLSLQWESFKATIGQGLINVLTPVVQWLNAIMEAAQGAAQAFANFTATIMGVEPDMSGLSATTAAAAESAQEINEGVAAAGGSAKKAMKQLAGFDKLNILSKQSYGGGGGGKGSSVSSAGIKEASKEDSKLNTYLSETRKKLADIARTLTGSFRQGFEEGFGGFDFGPTLQNIQGIRDSIVGIMTNPSVQSAGMRFMTNLAEGMGKTSGSMARIGSVAAQTVTGGIERFLTSHDNQIRNYIVDMFDISGETAQITGDLSVSAANIFEGAFGTPVAETLVSDLINIPAQIYMTTSWVGASLARDILSGFYTIIGQNEGGLTTVLSGLVSFAASVFGTISTAVTDMGNTVRSVYDEYVSPFISNMSEDLSELYAVILEFWQENVQPVLDSIAERFSILWNEHLKPLFDNLAAFIGKLLRLIEAIWKTAIQPLIEWIVKNVLPVIMPIIRTIINVVMDVAGIIGSIISGFLAQLGSLCDFLTGVFTGDWNLAWEGIKESFSAAWDTIHGILDGVEDVFEDVFGGVVDVIKEALNMGIGEVEGFVNGIINGVNRIINGINSVSQGAGGGQVISPLETISLPRLANGGFVEANTPQLAVIGDNRHQGEFVAPEDKLKAAVGSAMLAMMPQMAMAMANAVAKANTGNSGTINLHNVIELDGEVVYENQEKIRRSREKRSGGN